jgi:hypothetical protein
MPVAFAPGTLIILLDFFIIRAQAETKISFRWQQKNQQAIANQTLKTIRRSVL